MPPQFITTRPPHVLLQIYVSGGAISGWIIFNPQRRVSETAKFHERLGRDLGVFHSWVRSIQLKTARAVNFGVSGVRLLWEEPSGTPHVLAAYCTDETKAFEPSLGRAVIGGKKPKPPNAGGRGGRARAKGNK